MSNMSPHQPLRDLFGSLGSAPDERENIDATRRMVSRALDRGLLCNVYQPVVSARAPRQISFHESLIRLSSPTGALLPPGQFLPAIAESDLMLRLDRTALDNTLKMLAAVPHARISVNIATGALEDPEWMDLLERAVRTQPDIGFRLIIEMTEDPAFLSNPACHPFLDRLRHFGISVALDDFGAGGTGFRHFRDYRFDIVKLDGTYGDGLHRNMDAQALVTAMVGLANHFEMVTVLEYVADPKDAVTALSMGIDCLQGFLFGRPAEALGTPDDPDLPDTANLG